MAGLFGYFAYDLKQHIETLAVTCMDTGLPDLCLYAPRAIVVEDRIKATTTLFIPGLSPRGKEQMMGLSERFEPGSLLPLTRRG